MSTSELGGPESVEQKRARLAQLLQEQAAKQRFYTPSFVQERLWFLSQLAENAPIYTMPLIIRLSGDLDIGALEGSLNTIVQRHEILRTHFPLSDGRPVAAVQPSLHLKLHVVDLSAAAAESTLETAVLEEIERPFDLAQGPLIRAALFHYGATQYVLSVSLHHIVTDVWSFSIFMRELGQLYTAAAAGRPVTLAPLPMQYREYALRQRSEQMNSQQTQQLAYWREQLAGAPAALDLPTDFPRPRRRTFQGASHVVRLSPALTVQLQRLSQKHETTLFMTLLAAFQALLARYSGQSDVLVGVPVSTRTHPAQESLIGPFVNTLVLRTKVDGWGSVRSLLAAVRQTCLAGLAHQDLPFEQLVEALQPQRQLDRTPLFQVFFSFTGAPLPTPTMAGLTVQHWSLAGRSAEVDLALVLGHTADGLEGRLIYEGELFTAATIARMEAHLVQLLEAIVANPDQPIGQLAMLTEEEQRQMAGWNATHRPIPATTLPVLFEAQAIRALARPALRCGAETLDYATLNARANQLAHYLRARSIGPEARVGLCLERSVELVVGLLAILKAGAAYVPLDPAYPSDRLAFMIRDAGIAMILTQRGIAPELPGSELTLLDQDWPRIAEYPTSNPPATASPDNLAYVIYTSGSTGVPKGVMVSHRNVVNFFVGMDRGLGDIEPAVWSAVTSVSFDISVLELIWTLTRGCQVVIQGEMGALRPDTVSAGRTVQSPMEFSLSYFANDDGSSPDSTYHLLIEGAKFADRHGFSAVWTPERHFHSFGGGYPNPSVVSAALAMITDTIRIRAGSVVAPLHHPIRIAEEWAVVDNLSQGRVDVSFASGWHADDFALAPQNYTDRKNVMLESIETVRKLWSGEPSVVTGPVGQSSEVRLFPKPVQAELPVWLTAAGNPETFRMAAEIGANILTHLLGQEIDDLANKIALYRETWQRHGHSRRGHVSLMLHCFIGDDIDQVREVVRQPFYNYLRNSWNLVANQARATLQDGRGDGLIESNMESLLPFVFERYFATSGLLGTPETCLAVVDRLSAIGVDEVACLIDFGVDFDLVMESLQHLNQLKELNHRRALRTEAASQADGTAEPPIVTHLQCTPSMAKLSLMNQELAPSFSTLRMLLLGGEALSTALVKQLRQVTTGQLYNMYGPTETTIWSTMHRLAEEDPAILIGKPIANTEIYLLDRYFQQVPVGVPGEVYIGGLGVSRGYHGRPGLTAERFLPNPYSATPGARYYRTGDLARYWADGSVEYLGRCDQQVKLRGFRIEPGEIEVVLRKHPAVQQAVVVVRTEATDAEPVLAAYLVVHQPAPSVSALRAFARTLLPDYMVPTAFVVLDRIPLTPNGKIDRAALPSLSGHRPHLERAYLPPRTPVEEVLASIWAEVLGVERIGVYDNFFDLGGHSVRVIQAIARLQDIFSMTIPLRAFFEWPMIEAFADGLIAMGRAQAIDVTHIAQIFIQLDTLTEAEVQALLEEKSKSSAIGTAG